MPHVPQKSLLFRSEQFLVNLIYEPLCLHLPLLPLHLYHRLHRLIPFLCLLRGIPPAGLGLPESNRMDASHSGQFTLFGVDQGLEGGGLRRDCIELLGQRGDHLAHQKFLVGRGGWGRGLGWIEKRVSLRVKRGRGLLLMVLETVKILGDTILRMLSNRVLELLAWTSSSVLKLRRSLKILYWRSLKNR